jgi:hypothetical protein
VERKVPPRNKFKGIDPRGVELYLSGKEWNDIATKNKFEWKKVGDPREGVKDLCGGGYEIWID